jgi:probable HAF family extracellular repeat protein
VVYHINQTKESGMYRFQDRLSPFMICHPKDCCSAAAVFVMPLLWSNVCLAESKVRYTVIDIGTLGAECYPTGMNSKGHITGISRIAVGNQWRAFLWRNGTLEDIGSLGNDTQAAAISDEDEIAGTYRRDFQSGSEDHQRAGSRGGDSR